VKGEKASPGLHCAPNKNPTQDLKSTILVKVKPKGEREALEHEILTHHNSRSPAQSFSTLKKHQHWAQPSFGDFKRVIYHM